MQHAADLRDLFDYCYWANEKLFRGLSQLPDEDFTREVAGSYGSVRNTLVHALSAEWGWLDRCGGYARGPKLQPADFPRPDVLIAAWREVERHMRPFLEGLGDADLARVIEFSIGPHAHSMPLGTLMRHAALHGIHHRGQVALLMRLLGRPAGDFDYLFYGNGLQV